MKFCNYLFLLAFFSYALEAPAAAPSAAAAKEDLLQLRSRIEALQQQMAGAEASRSEAADALRASERAISVTNRDLAGLEQSSVEVSKQREALQGESHQASVALALHQKTLARLLHSQYLRQYVHQGGGPADTLRLLLSGENPNAIARDLHYWRYVSHTHADVIRGTRDSMAKLQALADQAVVKSAELAAIGAQQILQRKRLEAEKARRADVVTRLSRDIRRNRNDLGTLQRNESRLTNLLEQLAKVIPRPPSPAPRQRSERNERVPEPGTVTKAFSQLRGSLALPVRGELSGHFGRPRHEGGTTWKGVFVTAKAGTAVRAVAGGRVVYADWLRGFGNLLIIDHGESYMSLYGHNETLFKQVGEVIGGGDAIATVGNSGGGGEDSGLYFELRHQGRPFDPLTWVGRR